LNLLIVFRIAALGTTDLYSAAKGSVTARQDPVETHPSTTAATLSLRPRPPP
jgi:hypothetical protein